jgi:hypothetical protein
VQGVGGSNPLAPTNRFKELEKAALCGFFVFGNLVRSLVRKISTELTGRRFSPAFFGGSRFLFSSPLPASPLNVHDPAHLYWANSARLRTGATDPQRTVGYGMRQEGYFRSKCNEMLP